MSKKILISPNAFKHSLSSIEVAGVIKNSVKSYDINLPCQIAPIADGGDGSIDILNFYFNKSKYIDCQVQDPLGRSINSKWLLLEKDVAVIELAKASGISLLSSDELNPMWANTYGTGQLINSALNEGCKKIIIAVGGSATVDAGVGALQALGVKFFDNKKHLVKAGGGFLTSINEFSLSGLNKNLKGVSLHVLCDVQIPLTGEKGTVNKFSAQKGAKEGERVILEKGMKHYAKIVKETINSDCENEPMVGAAGGVSFSLKSILDAELFSGFSYLSKLTSLEEKIKESDLIITGEGRLDNQTILGKGVFEIVKLSKKYDKEIVVLCGSYDGSINWKSHDIDNIIQIQPDGMSLDESLKNTKELLEVSIKTYIEYFINN